MSLMRMGLKLMDTISRQINDVENQEQVVAQCLEIYLRTYQRDLQRCELTSGISQTVYNVQKIFNQLQYRIIGLDFFKADLSSQKLIWVCFQILHAIHNF